MKRQTAGKGSLIITILLAIVGIGGFAILYWWELKNSPEIKPPEKVEERELPKERPLVPKLTGPSVFYSGIESSVSVGADYTLARSARDSEPWLAFDEDPRTAWRIQLGRNSRNTAAFTFRFFETKAVCRVSMNASTTIPVRAFVILRASPDGEQWHTVKTWNADIEETTTIISLAVVENEHTGAPKSPSLHHADPHSAAAPEAEAEPERKCETAYFWRISVEVTTGPRDADLSIESLQISGI